MNDEYLNRAIESIKLARDNAILGNYNSSIDHYFSARKMINQTFNKIKISSPWDDVFF